MNARWALWEVYCFGRSVKSPLTCWSVLCPCSVFLWGEEGDLYNSSFIWLLLISTLRRHVMIRKDAFFARWMFYQLIAAKVVERRWERNSWLLVSWWFCKCQHSARMLFLAWNVLEFRCMLAEDQGRIKRNSQDFWVLVNGKRNAVNADLHS